MNGLSGLSGLSGRFGSRVGNCCRSDDSGRLRPDFMYCFGLNEYPNHAAYCAPSMIN